MGIYLIAAKTGTDWTEGMNECIHIRLSCLSPALLSIKWTIGQCL